MRNIFAVTISLEHKGAIVEISLNGHETIERLEPHNDVDLVLMVDDAVVGLLRGYLTDSPATVLVQVADIAVTAKAMKDDQRRSLRAGANHYLAKPGNGYASIWTVLVRRSGLANLTCLHRSWSPLRQMKVYSSGKVPAWNLRYLHADWIPNVRQGVPGISSTVELFCHGHLHVICVNSEAFWRERSKAFSGNAKSS